MLKRKAVDDLLLEKSQKESTNVYSSKNVYVIKIFFAIHDALNVEKTMIHLNIEIFPVAYGVLEKKHNLKTSRTYA